MKYELGFFEDFIKTECRKNKKTSPQSNVPDFEKKKTAIEDEVDRVKKTLAEHIFQVDNEGRIELFVQHHQAKIISMADKVVSHLTKEDSVNIKAISSEHSRINLCKVLLQNFEGLLNYIEAYFSKYFDQDQKIPDAYAFISAKELEGQLDTLLKIFEEQKLDGELSRVVLFPIQNFINNSSRGITFRRLIYLKYVAKEFMRLASETDTFSEAVYERLFYLNFNNHYFRQFAVNKIRNVVDALPSMAEQMEYLSLTLKKLNQAQVKPAFALKPEHHSIKNVIAIWLEEEIHYIEKKR